MQTKRTHDRLGAAPIDRGYISEHYATFDQYLGLCLDEVGATLFIARKTTLIQVRVSDFDTGDYGSKLTGQVAMSICFLVT